MFNLVRGSFRYFLVLRNPITKTQFEYGTNLSYFRLININSKKSKSQIISSNAGSTPCFTVADTGNCEFSPSYSIELDENSDVKASILDALNTAAEYYNQDVANFFLSDKYRDSELGKYIYNMYNIYIHTFGCTQVIIPGSGIEN